MPVPLQRNNPNRRNEYVNMPVGMPQVNSHPMPAISNDVQSVSSASPDLSSSHIGHASSQHAVAPPLPPHNYANMPINKNPLPPPRNEDQRPISNGNVWNRGGAGPRTVNQNRYVLILQSGQMGPWIIKVLKCPNYP